MKPFEPELVPPKELNWVTLVLARMPKILAPNGYSMI